MDGYIAPGFEGVAAAFENNFAEHAEVGAAFAAYRGGELVVDLWGGLADPADRRPWSRDTLQLVFSGTKGLVAACVLLLAERGRLDLEAPVARYWPGFAAAGKAALTVGEVMSHQAGLTFPGGDPLDHAEQVERLERRRPHDGIFLYHALTYGTLADELIRRTDGRTAARFFAEEFAAPLGLDVWIGLPDAEHHRASAMLAAPGFLLTPGGDAFNDNPLTREGAEAIWNGAAFRRSGHAAVGAYGTARDLARFYAVLATERKIHDVRPWERRRGTEFVWGSPMAYATGFELNTELEVLGPVPDAYGHAGAGGSRHGAWPGLGVGFSYAMNEARAAYPDPRPTALLQALRRAL